MSGSQAAEFPEAESAYVLLEVGCGVGAQTVHLRASSPGARLVSMPFVDGAFDHVFVCFVLEHLSDPLLALIRLRRILRPGGTITVIEGDHGSAFFHPDGPAARAAIACLIQLQAASGGDGLIGRQLYPLLAAAGYGEVEVGGFKAHAVA